MSRAWCAARWARTWARIEAEPLEDLAERLFDAYEEPHRAYHTLAHLEECFMHLDAAPESPADPIPFELALWFHDAIYDTRAPDSEARSAAWAVEALAFLGDATTAAVERLILATAHATRSSDPDERLLLDVDLSILGASAPRFAEYERQVRREYEWVPEAAYREARSRILTTFADRERLYQSDSFHAAFEDRARANLTRSIADLAT